MATELLLTSGVEYKLGLGDIVIIISPRVSF